MKEFIMSKQFDKKFKEDAAKYYFEHRKFGLKGCAENLEIRRMHWLS